ncbi:LAFA_0B00980g1_1 [Lachancea sp. 'fantastica']|nr:LAFA_0B00980g1_1 [Lachancea sp. 'fantastica']
MIVPEGIFIGGNRQTQVSSFSSQHEILAFGAGKTIALWKPLDSSSHGVYRTLKGHNAEVTCVRFVHGTDLLISASEDFQIRIWRKHTSTLENGRTTFECIQTLTHHKHTITAISVLETMFVVGCADGSVSIWGLGAKNEAKLMHVFEPKKNTFPLSLALQEIDENKVLLAVGGTNTNVFIYSFLWEPKLLELSEFQQAAVLEGHEDWIKAIDFHQESAGNLMLATGSQDRYIRLWKIRANELIDNSDEDKSKLKLLSNKQSKFTIGSDFKVAISFEALIIGHDDWISSLQWHENQLRLMASTADTAVMVWEPDEDSGVWVCTSRLGELSSKGASTATGSAGGFWSSNWLIKGGEDYIVTNGKTGSWRMWKSDGAGLWEQHLAPTGPVKSVTDVAWAPNGRYLLLTSLDQTTRLVAKCIDRNSKSSGSWFEFSRPQIHGYDMTCVEPISNTRFVSGADEKIIRSFEEPKGVAQILSRFSGIPIENENSMPESASLPALGLSSKATTEAELEEDDDPDVRESNETKNISFDLIASSSEPPIEDQLQRHTLWPEIEKLYGHGYEISCLDVSPDARLVASACKSNNTQHAVIRIFDVGAWLQVRPAEPFHNLTITRLRFSKDNTHLLSVSRDRQWAVWERNPSTNEFDLVHKNEKAHTRIIWDCEWAPLGFGKVFFTASRDKSVKAWRFTPEAATYTQVSQVKLSEPVTALAVYPELIDGKVLLAIGLESGSVQLQHYGDDFNKLFELNDEISAADRINRLRWSSYHEDGSCILAAASADHSARIYSVEINHIESASGC